MCVCVCVCQWLPCISLFSAKRVKDMNFPHLVPALYVYILSSQRRPYTITRVNRLGTPSARGCGELYLTQYLHFDGCLAGDSFHQYAVVKLFPVLHDGFFHTANRTLFSSAQFLSLTRTQ